MAHKWERFRVGQVLVVLVPQRTEVREYNTKVQDFNADHLILSAPTDRGRALDLPSGTNITLMVKEGGSLRSYSSTVERTRMGQVPLWVITKPEANPSEVRRGFYRLETFLPISFAMAEPKDKIEIEYTQQGVVCNLSGGGLGIIYTHHVNAGSSVGMLLTLDDLRLALWGKVMRCDEMTNAKMTRYLLGIQFINISTKDQDLVIKYIFKEQLRQRQKGLI
ncbi:MAG: flagellar brake protein [Bacillota bacterium]